MTNKTYEEILVSIKSIGKYCNDNIKNNVTCDKCKLNTICSNCFSQMPVCFEDIIEESENKKIDGES